MLFIGLVLASVLGSAGKPGVAAAGLSYVNLSAHEGDAFIDTFAEQLAKEAEVEVFTRSQFEQLLGAERQRQLMGCPDVESRSCLAEMSNALGAEYFVTGSLGKLGSVFTVTFKLVSSSTAAALSAYSSRARDEEQLLDKLSEAATQFAAVLRSALTRPTAGVSASAVSATTSSRFGPRFFIAAGISLVGFVTAGVLFGISGGAANRLRTQTFESADSISATGQTGQFTQTAGWVALGTAGVAAVLTVVLLFLPPSNTTTALFDVARRGGTFAW